LPVSPPRSRRLRFKHQRRRNNSLHKGEVEGHLPRRLIHDGAPRPVFSCSGRGIPIFKHEAITRKFTTVNQHFSACPKVSIKPKRRKRSIPKSYDYGHNNGYAVTGYGGVTGGITVTPWITRDYGDTWDYWDYGDTLLNPQKGTRWVGSTIVACYRWPRQASVFN
jgi:hypothetical protein